MIINRCRLYKSKCLVDVKLYAWAITASEKIPVMSLDAEGADKSNPMHVSIICRKPFINCTFLYGSGSSPKTPLNCSKKNNQKDDIGPKLKINLVTWACKCMLGVTESSPYKIWKRQQYWSRKACTGLPWFWEFLKLIILQVIMITIQSSVHILHCCFQNNIYRLSYKS